MAPNKILAHLGISFLLFSILLPLSTSATDFSQHIKTKDHFTIKIPLNWEEIPKATLKELSDILYQQTKKRINYKYGFQLSSDDWLTYPYILIDIKSGKVPPKELAEMDRLEVHLDKEADMLEDAFSDSDANFSFGKPVYDEKNNIVWFESELSGDGQESNALTGVVLTEKGAIQINAYSAVEDYEIYKPIFRELILNVVLDENYVYNPDSGGGDFIDWKLYAAIFVIVTVINFFRSRSDKDYEEEVSSTPNAKEKVFLKKLDQLEADGKHDDAIALIKTEKSLVESSPELGKRYLELLKKSSNDSIEDNKFLEKLGRLEKEERYNDAFILIKQQKHLLDTDPDLGERYLNILKKTNNLTEINSHCPMLLDLLVKKELKEKACKVYLDYKKLAPDFIPKAESLFSIAGWFKDLGQIKQSLTSYVQLIKKHSRHPLLHQAYFEIGKIYNEHLDNPKKAQTILNSLLNKSPNHRLGQEVKNYLDNMNFIEL